jgi:hypothetical protein
MSISELKVFVILIKRTDENSDIDQYSKLF